ncbi:MAG: hypothetical protein DRR15_19270 [Gammaproteobacteria bacterium]|nr:MAG: hypothetical protein DRR15_19270 [Gammaproteobacteria bacterium]
MKLLTIDSREVTGRPGVLLDSGDILDLAVAPSTLSESQWIPHSVVSVIAAGRDGLERIARLVKAAERADRQQLLAAGALLPYSGTALMAPIRRPGLVLIINSNQSNYIKSPNAAIGNDATVNIPWADVDTLWGIPMLAMVLGRQIFKASESEAADAIAGYTLMIDLNGRDPIAVNDSVDQRKHIETRQFPGACPIGPTIITSDEFHDPIGSVASVRINDVEVGSGSLWPDGHQGARLLAELSQSYGFRPGDLVAFEPSADSVGAPRKLHPGDRFTVTYTDMIELAVTIA